MKLIYLAIAAATFATFPCACSSSSKADTEQAEEEEEGETNEVDITETQLNIVGIKLGQIERKSLSNVVRATGQLAVNPQDEAVVSPLYSGIISRICVVEGQRVKAGQTIAYIENTDIVAAQQNYLTAAQEKDIAQQEYNRQKSLADQGAGVRKNLEQAEAALKVAQTKQNGLAQQLRQLGINPVSVGQGSISNTIAVSSPITGVVSKVYAKTGSYADMQTPIASVVNNDAVYCELQIFEKYLSQVGQGQRVEVKLTNAPEQLIPGEIIDINHAIDPETKTLTVRVKLLNHDAEMIPGMAVTALINSEAEEVDALPDDAVVSAGGKSYIFVLDGIAQGDDDAKTYHFVKTEVVEGAKALGYTQITPINPLPQDATVVIANAFYLNSMASDHGDED
jgi:cobalt-zinc-cadmium efflux system membrane fusion protein